MWWLAPELKINSTPWKFRFFEAPAIPTKQLVEYSVSDSIAKFTSWDPFLDWQFRCSYFLLTSHSVSIIIPVPQNSQEVLTKNLPRFGVLNLPYKLLNLFSYLLTNCNRVLEEVFWKILHFNMLYYKSFLKKELFNFLGTVAKMIRLKAVI